MGLDSVELVMAIEEKFGIAISDEEAQNIRTVGDMYECVIGKVAVTDRSSCLTQKAFHLLRRSARQLFNVPRDRFRPDTQLDAIVPHRFRSAHWRRFQDETGASKWPRLSVSWPGVFILLALLFATPVFAFEYAVSTLKWNSVIAVAIAFGSTIPAVLVSKLLARPFETRFGKGISTVHDLAYAVVAQNPALFGASRVTWTPDETWPLLALVIKEQTGTSQFTKDSRFVEDLKID